MDAFSLSNEIPINDLIKIYKTTNANIYYQVFGRKLMFYSKRKLISCYEKHNEIALPKNSLFIREEKREDLMPVFENDNGYTVYRPYHLNLLKEIKNLSFIKYAYIESLTLNNDQLLAILKAYKNYNNNVITYYGADVDEAKAEELSNNLSSKYKKCDIELQYGGQPIYYYIVSAE